MQDWLIGIALGVGLSFAVGKFLPGFLIGKIRVYLELAKVSPWWRDAAKPWRWALLKAIFQFFEGELPDEGTPEVKPFYEKWGNRIVAWLSFIPVLRGSAKTWASALEKAGNKLDTALKDDIKGMDAPKP